MHSGTGRLYPNRPVPLRREKHTPRSSPLQNARTQQKTTEFPQKRKKKRFSAYI